METKNESALIIFAREPRFGKVKTRLAKDVGDKSALTLYKAFVRDVLKTAGSVQCDEKFIYYAGQEENIPFLRQFQDHFKLRKQSGRDLGERMFRAFRQADKDGFSKKIIIGTDCLTMTARDINSAFEKLKVNQCVIGPANDGGYYLLGLITPEEKLFTGIEWGYDSVYTQTLQKLKSLDWNVCQLPAKEDIDRLDSLRRVFKSLQEDKDPHSCLSIIYKVLNSSQSV